MPASKQPSRRSRRSNTIAEDEVLLPVNIERVQIWGDVPTTIWSHGRLRGTPDREARTFTLDLDVYDPEGRALGEIAGLQLKRVKRERSTGLSRPRTGLAVRDSMERGATTERGDAEMQTCSANRGAG